MPIGPARTARPLTPFFPFCHKPETKPPKRLTDASPTTQGHPLRHLIQTEDDDDDDNDDDDDDDDEGCE